MGELDALLEGEIVALVVGAVAGALPHADEPSERHQLRIETLWHFDVDVLETLHAQSFRPLNPRSSLVAANASAATAIPAAATASTHAVIIPTNRNPTCHSPNNVVDSTYACCHHPGPVRERLSRRRGGG